MSGSWKQTAVLVAFLAAMVSPVLAAEPVEPPANEPPRQKLKLAGGDSDAEKKPAATDDDRFTVPKGTPKELVAYITKLISGEPPRDLATLTKMRKAILEAAEKILAAKPNDEEMEFAVQAKMNMLEKPEQFNAFIDELKKNNHEKLARLVRGFMLQVDLRKTMLSGSKDAKKTIEEVVKFFEEASPQVADITLAYTAGLMSEMGGDREFAAKTYERLAKVFAASKDPKLAEFAKVLQGVVRRLNLVGQEFKLEGKTLDGKPFDWTKYQGKIVLVNFWASEYPACARDIPNLKGLYELYHDKGFDIVGVCLDSNIENLAKFVKAKSIPWVNLVGDGKKPHSGVIEYGVMNLPTQFLVGKDGKVLSVNAYGESLRRQLEKLLGPADTKKDADTKKEEAEKSEK